MSRVLLHVLMLGGALASAQAMAADIPRPSAEDPRIRVAIYNPMDVTVIRVKRGAVTRIYLAPGEKIESAPTGVSSRCGEDLDDWCVHAPKGTNQIVVRPKEKATTNNIELSTDLREYSIELRVVPDDAKPSSSNDAFYRVSFEYPQKQGASNQALVAGLLAAIEPRPEEKLADELSTTPVSATEKLKAVRPAPKNSNYTMQVMKGGDDAAPSMVFDDGRFTYFEFNGAREIPAVFAHGSDGEPARVNWHFQTPFVVVERMARKFTLRLGSAVVGVFNEAFDPVGESTPTGTISGAVVRVVKESGQ